MNAFKLFGIPISIILILYGILGPFIFSKSDNNSGGEGCGPSYGGTFATGVILLLISTYYGGC